MNTSPPPESSSRSAAAPTRTTPGTIVIGSTCWAVMTPMIADPQTPRPSCVYYCTLRTPAPAIHHTKVHVKALDARLGALPCQESWVLGRPGDRQPARDQDTDPGRPDRSGQPRPPPRAARPRRPHRRNHAYTRTRRSQAPGPGPAHRSPDRGLPPVRDRPTRAVGQQRRRARDPHGETPPENIRRNAHPHRRPTLRRPTQLSRHHRETRHQRTRRPYPTHHRKPLATSNDLTSYDSPSCGSRRSRVKAAGKTPRSRTTAVSSPTAFC